MYLYYNKDFTFTFLFTFLTSRIILNLQAVPLYIQTETFACLEFLPNPQHSHFAVATRLKTLKTDAVNHISF